MRPRDAIDRTVKTGSGWSCTIRHTTTGETLAIGTSLDHEAAVGRAFAQLLRKTFGDRAKPERPHEWIVAVALDPLK